MIFEIPINEINDLLIRQLTSFFPLSKDEQEIINDEFDAVLLRCEVCFNGNPNKYYSKNGETYFNPFHSGQYSIFLYYFSNTVFKSRQSVQLANKIYYLNKVMNGCDLFYEIDLPEIFKLDHPVGSVMGRAKYGNHFSFAQNCTVGNNRGTYPRIGNNVKMCAKSMILGNSVIGNDVILGAECCIKDEDIPPFSMVFGSSPNLIIKNLIR